MPACLSANIGFIRFDSAFEFIFEGWLFECVSNAVRHKQRRAVAAQTENALKLKRTDSLFGTANHIPCDEPLAERDVAVFKNSSDGSGELASAFGAVIQTSADFLRFIRRHLVNAVGLFVPAVRADRAFGPVNRFPILAGGFVSGEPLVNLVERQFAWGWQHVRFHAPNIAENTTFVKWLLFLFYIFISLIFKGLQRFVFAT